MSVEPAGLFSLPMAELRDRLSKSVAYQQWLGWPGAARSEADALDSIHYYSAPPVTYDRPWLSSIIDLAQDWSGDNQILALQSPTAFDFRGDVVWYVNAPQIQDEANDQAIEFSNYLSQCALEVLLQNPDQGLIFQSISMNIQPTRSTQDDDKMFRPYWEAALTFTWSQIGGPANSPS